MHFDYINNHIVADIGGKKCLIDTGSPFSLGEGVIIINDIKHVLNGGTFMGATLDSISRAVGTHLDALIGADILSKHEGVFVWINSYMQINFCISIGPEKDLSNKNEVPVDFFNLVPIISINIQGQTVKAFIDTGAKQSYLDSTLAVGLPIVGSVGDFYPTIGEFTTPTVQAKYVEPTPTMTGPEDSALIFGIMPASLLPLLSVKGCKAILGLDWLKNGNKSHFQINYRDKRFFSD